MEFNNNKKVTRKEKEKGKPRNRLLTIENKLMVTRGEVGGRGGDTGEGEGLKRTLLVMSTE